MILLIVVLILLFGGFSWYGQRNDWGYGRSYGGGLGLILLILLMWWLFGGLQK